MQDTDYNIVLDSVSRYGVARSAIRRPQMPNNREFDYATSLEKPFLKVEQ